MSVPPVGSAESRRLHEDWWGKCRTCRFWDGADEVRPREGMGPLISLRMKPAICTNPKSDMVGQETWTEGNCDKWDSFDVEMALSLVDN